MNQQRNSKSVCIVVHGLNSTNHYLQPWRYVTEVGVQLQRNGFSTVVLTDMESGEDPVREIRGLPIRHLNSVRCFRWFGNRDLDREISAIDPSYLIWSIGLTSFLHQQFPNRSDRVQIGIFSSPIYTLEQLGRIGARKLISNHTLSGIHLLGALAPRAWLRYNAAKFHLSCLVTQTETLRSEISGQLWKKRIDVISPGVDPIWLGFFPGSDGCRFRLGVPPGAFLVMYLGPPDLLRGLPSLIEAIRRVRSEGKNVKLIILNRVPSNKPNPGTRKIELLIRRNNLQDDVIILNGVQQKERLAEICSAADLIALPFELIPSDAPLSILEARAMRKPILSTRLGSIPELCGQGQVYLADPGNIGSIAHQIQKALENQFRGAVFPNDDTSNPIPTWDQVGSEWAGFMETLEKAS